jgi:acyl-[acyl-carrier-protein]-phospholipid O-acyltransferase/long-chain-fatty-acid--[acyl-carrier-protein] ligase
MILHHEFIKIAKQFSHKTAIDDKTTGGSITYEKALIAALILSKKLRRFEDQYIGIMIPTSMGCILAVLGVLFLRKIPVMINYSTGAETNCRYAQKTCGFSAIITSRALLEKIKCPIVPGMVCIEDILKEVTIFDKIKALLKTKKKAERIIAKLPPAEIDDTVVILFTSGSEKEPKAVQLSHRNIGSNVHDAQIHLPITSDDIMFCILPLFHVFGYTINLWLPMTMGMTTLTYANPLEYRKIAQIIKSDKPTIIAGTPSFFAGYLRESSPRDFESLRLVIPGADKTPEWLRHGYKQKHGIDLLEGYGCTETSPVVSVNSPAFYRPGSIGKLFPSVQVKIVDPDTGEEKPAGQEGKILVKGELVMKGYLDPAETAKSISDGWYDTGDIGMLDADGYLWHKGRYKRFIKVGGEMVSLVKTESVLESILPEGIECCVVEALDEFKGSRLVAALSKAVDEDLLVKELSNQLPPIAIPKKFVYLAELPKQIIDHPIITVFFQGEPVLDGKGELNQCFAFRIIGTNPALVALVDGDEYRRAYVFLLGNRQFDDSVDIVGKIDPRPALFLPHVRPDPVLLVGKRVNFPRGDEEHFNASPVLDGGVADTAGINELWIEVIHALIESLNDRYGRKSLCRPRFQGVRDECHNDCADDDRHDNDDADRPYVPFPEDAAAKVIVDVLPLLLFEIFQVGSLGFRERPREAFSYPRF